MIYPFSAPSRPLVGPLSLDDGRTRSRSCSIGFCCFPPCPEQPDAMSWEQAVRCADAALLGVKRSGRNAWLGLVTAQGRQPADLRPLADAAVEDWIGDARFEIARGPAAQG